MENEMNFTLPAWALAAVAPFMAKNDVRFYLSSVYVAPVNGPDGAKGCAVVATDGDAALAVVRLREVNVPGPVLLPREAVEWAVKAKGDDVAFALAGESGKDWTMTAGGASRPVSEIDSQFPDWQAVVPEPLADEPAEGAQRLEYVAFDAALIERVVKSAKVLHKAGIVGGRRIGAAVVPDMRGQRASCWTCSGYKVEGVDVAWVLMPLRVDVEPCGVKS